MNKRKTPITKHLIFIKKLQLHVTKPDCNALLNEIISAENFSVINNAEETKKQYLTIVKNYDYYYNTVKRAIYLRLINNRQNDTDYLKKEALEKINDEITQALKIHLQKLISPILIKARRIKSLALFIHKKENEFQSPLITMEAAQPMVPHLCVKQLLQSRRIRGMKYQGWWYYVKKDIEEIANEERHHISCVKKLMRKQHGQYCMGLHKILIKTYYFRRKLLKKEISGDHGKLITEFDKLIARIEKLYEKMREENKK